MRAHLIAGLVGSILTVVWVGAAYPQQDPAKTQGPNKPQSSQAISALEDEFLPPHCQTPSNSRVRIIVPQPEVIYRNCERKEPCEVGHHLCSLFERWKAKCSAKHCCAAPQPSQAAPAMSPPMAIVPYTYNIPYTYHMLMPVSSPVAVAPAGTVNFSPSAYSLNLSPSLPNASPVSLSGLQGITVAPSSSQTATGSDAQLLQQLLTLARTNQESTPPPASPSKSPSTPVGPAAQTGNQTKDDLSGKILELKSQLVDLAGSTKNRFERNEERLTSIEQKLEEARLQLKAQMQINDNFGKRIKKLEQLPSADDGVSGGKKNEKGQKFPNNQEPGGKRE